jgi:hypothetical protein
MTRIIALYGTIAGLIVAVPMVWLMLSMKPGTSMEGGAIYGFLTMIIALTAVFLGVKQYRDKVLGGAIKFGPALLLGLGISAVASLFYTVGWEISLAYTDFDFAEVYSKSLQDKARAEGASDEELRKMMAQANSFAEKYKNPLFRMSVTFLEMFPVGILISLISAGLLRNNRLLPARAPS